MMHQIIKPNYSYDALEPYIDAKTMEVHTEKHHQAYADKLNDTLKNFPELQDHSLEYLLTHLPGLPEAARVPVKNFGGGVANHNFFWTVLAPKFDQPVPRPLADALNRTFGSIDDFKKEFSGQAAALFGSGWTWLVLRDATLAIVTTANQDSPVSQGLSPIFGIDVWEHAYYLKYQNRRPEYIQAFWHVVNWNQANENYESSIAE